MTKEDIQDIIERYGDGSIGYAIAKMKHDEDAIQITRLWRKCGANKKLQEMAEKQLSPEAQELFNFLLLIK